MAEKHTPHIPGPYSLLLARTLINVKGPKGEQICQLQYRDLGTARLIAAAPELLTASIRMMVGINKESRPDCEYYEGIAQDGADEAKSIITQATGPAGESE